MPRWLGLLLLALCMLTGLICLNFSWHLADGGVLRRLREDSARCMRCAAEFAWADSAALQCIHCSTSQRQAPETLEFDGRHATAPCDSTACAHLGRFSSSSSSTWRKRSGCSSRPWPRSAADPPNSFSCPSAAASSYLCSFLWRRQVTSAKAENNKSSVMLNQQLAAIFDCELRNDYPCHMCHLRTGPFELTRSVEWMLEADGVCRGWVHCHATWHRRRRPL